MKAQTVKVVLSTVGASLSARLDNTPAARAFAEMLPLTLTLSDYAATEKVADLPARLPDDAAKAGHTPRRGDIAYYAPWGNLAIFHKDFRHSPGLILLGRLDGDVSILATPGPVDVRIDRAESK